MPEYVKPLSVVKVAEDGKIQGETLGESLDSEGGYGLGSAVCVLEGNVF